MKIELSNKLIEKLKKRANVSRSLDVFEVVHLDITDDNDISISKSVYEKKKLSFLKFTELNNLREY